MDAIDGVVDASPSLKEAREDWYETATTGFGYGIIPELDSFLTDEERLKVVLALCDTARQRLIELGDPISPAMLNQINAGHRDSHFQREVPAAVFRETADRFTALIRDTPFHSANEAGLL